MQKSIIFSCWKSHRKSCLVQNILVNSKNADFRFFFAELCLISLGFWFVKCRSVVKVAAVQQHLVAVHQQHSLHCNAHHAAIARSPPPFPMSSTDILAYCHGRTSTCEKQNHLTLLRQHHQDPRDVLRARVRHVRRNLQS